MTAEPVPPDLDDLLARYGRPLIPPAPGFDPETLTRPVLEPATALELAGEGGGIERVGGAGDFVAEAVEVGHHHVGGVDTLLVVLEDEPDVVRILRRVVAVRKKGGETFLGDQ